MNKMMSVQGGDLSHTVFIQNRGLPWFVVYAGMIIVLLFARPQIESQHPQQLLWCPLHSSDTVTAMKCPLPEENCRAPVLHTIGIV